MAPGFPSLERSSIISAMWRQAVAWEDLGQTHPGRAVLAEIDLGILWEAEPGKGFRNHLVHHPPPAHACILSTFVSIKARPEARNLRRARLLLGLFHGIEREVKHGEALTVLPCDNRLAALSLSLRTIIRVCNGKEDSQETEFP